MKIFRNRTVIGVLCILLALIICFGITPIFSRSASEKTEIVRVTMDIKEGDEITAEMVQTVEVGAYNLPQNLMTDKKEVVGKYATADLAAGDYILSSKLSSVPAAENAYLYNLDGTKQAISVTIKSFATGLSGKLESGDIVTVIVADYQGKGETAIPPELQYVEVISVTASSGYDANTGEVVDEKELPSTVTLLVTTEQAKVLAELEQDSEDGSRELQLIRERDGRVTNSVVHTQTRDSENERQRIDQIALLDIALRFNPDIICVGEMRGPEANAAQEAARVGIAVLTTIHSNSSEGTYRRMVSLCKRAVDTPDDTLMGYVTEAYPIVVYCRQLENKQRRITNISECEILPDGSRRLHKLYEYHITDNHLEGDRFVIEGEHRKCEEISESLRRRFIENGMPLGELAQFIQGKEEDE